MRFRNIPSSDESSLLNISFPSADAPNVARLSWKSSMNGKSHERKTNGLLGTVRQYMPPTVYQRARKHSRALRKSLSTLSRAGIMGLKKQGRPC